MITAIQGRKRVVIDFVGPCIDGGRFPIKRTVGEGVTVQAHVFTDGHDHVRVELLYKHERQRNWRVVDMIPKPSDEWVASFETSKLGTCYFTVRAWISHFDTWQADLLKKYKANQDVTIDLKVGSDWITKAARIANKKDGTKLQKWGQILKHPEKTEKAVQVGTSDSLTALMHKYPDRSLCTTYDQVLTVSVDTTQAVFGTWYELFPRSFGPNHKHGTFADCEQLLPDIAKMGFDILYLPPIHPIGVTHRKGKNNATACGPQDPGCPWAIGSAKGGHKAVHPQLGSLNSFRHFVKKANAHGLDIALDLAFQCSPDHPYVKAHPEWFRWRPDGSVQYAENPPKKYEDILPLNFESPQWQSLWEELKSVVFFWIEQGIHIFRVDNPHTKPFAFWQWLIAETRRKHPEVIFLAEAFTRRKVMQRLAKIGFNQSYTYFTWRNTKWEIEQYIQELAHSEVGEYMRPNFWPNTPDILPQYLQYGGKAGFIIRLVLTATLSASYGIYGPAYELCVSEALPEKEEYLDSEKYELKQWDWKSRGSLRPVIERVNRIRHQNPALQTTRNVRVYTVDNEAMLCYGKLSKDRSNIIITVISIDPHHTQAGWVTLPLEDMGLDPEAPYTMHDLISDDKYIWQGPRNYIELDPTVMPAHILQVRKKLRREQDFDYYL